MTTLPGFSVDINQNPYLSVGGQDVRAIVTVTASKQLPDVDRGGEIGLAWTDDETLSARADPRVAHYTGQAELARGDRAWAVGGQTGS